MGDCIPATSANLSGTHRIEDLVRIVICESAPPLVLRVGNYCLVGS